MATEKKAMTVYVASHLYERIESSADADGRSVSNFVERILAEKVLGEPQRKTWSPQETSAQQDIVDTISRMAKRPASRCSKRK